MKMHRLIQTLIVVCLLVLYELATRMNWLDSFTFIPFSTMFVNMIENLTDPEYVTNHFGVTALEILASFMGAIIFGIIFGIILWRSDFAHHVLQPYLMLFYAIPFFALYPIFISIFGIGPLPVIMIGLFFALPAVITNTAIGFREIRKVLVKVGQSCNLSFRQMIVHIYFPAAWPFIFTGIKLAAAYSIIGVIATEFILSARGLGYTISYAYNNFDINGMYGSVLLVIMIALTVNIVLGFIEARAYRKNS
ncbi:ABC transporter permease [Peribacillus cavernae]|uniref:ABC transporter permease n=1 Tax=Peribacillus cavernae TaxID=1674310 RepID=A0A3S1B870_9BACI|nr:ABC transporter permease [Peribacillus cavernae]MDQ0217238.1 NitT/TauT family transport system permease protein [Peribacillus cavernae]RUQ30292.1 ABC transporter permease [Peribacillus cavernae]